MNSPRPLAAEGQSTRGTGDDLGAPGTAGGRRADIQGLRALAVVMVVAFHAGLSVSGGFTGVDVFFVISGFVITAMLLRELVGRGGLSFREFYARRVRRILPASALMISVVALASIAAIGPSSQHQTARTGQAGSLFVANVLLARARNGYFDVSPTGNPLLHVWSLSVEEQFYLVFPAILLVGFLVARRRFPRTDARRVVGSVVGVVAVASFGLSWYATTRAGGFSGPGSSLLSLFMSGQTRAQASQVAFYVAPARAWEFAVGSLLALAVPWISRLPRRVATVAGLAGTALILVAAFGISSTTPFPGTAALVPVAGAALLLVAGTVSTNWISSLLSTAPFTRLGDLSYSWYLWHWPMIVFALALFPMEDHAALIAAALSLIPAWASFRYLENPVRRNSRIRGRTAVAVAAVCVVVPLACSFVLMRAPKPSASAATRAFLQASNRGHADQARGCNRGVALNALPARCTFSVPDARGRIVLLGDSNAGQFAEPASQAATRSGFDLTIGTYPDCPFVDLVVASARKRRNTTYGAGGS